MKRNIIKQSETEQLKSWEHIITRLGVSRLVEVQASEALLMALLFELK